MTDRERAGALLERANAALGRLALDEALLLLSEAIPTRSRCRSWKALCNRAYCFEQLGRFKEALADAREANARAPTAKGCLRAGRAPICLDRFEEACNELNAAAERPGAGNRPPAAHALERRRVAAAAARPTRGPNRPRQIRQPTRRRGRRARRRTRRRGGRRAAARLAVLLRSCASAQHTLPVAPPARLPSQPNASAHAATGAVAADIARRGGGSYYYAHDRVIDHAEPVVPKRIDADGNLVSADLS